MDGVRFVAGSQRRRRRAPLLLLALLTGVMGGATASLVAGVSRSSSVVDRFAAAAPRVDVGVFGSGLSRQQMLAVPGVAAVATNTYVAMNRVDPDGAVGDGVNGFLYDYSVERSRAVRVLKGHFPDGSDPTAIAVNNRFVRQFGLSVGDDLEVRMYRRDQAAELGHGIYRPSGTTYVFHVQAVVRQALDVASEEVVRPARPGGVPAHQSRAYILFPYAFWATHQDQFLGFGEDFDVRLQKGAAGLGAFRAAMARAAPHGADLEPGSSTRRGSVDAPVDLETTALLGLGIALALTMVLVVALLLRIEQRALDLDTGPLQALGMTRGGLAAVAAVRLLPSSAMSGLLAAIVAIGLSGRYPIGIGRQLELDGGLQVNLAVVAAGAALTMLLVLLIAPLVAVSRRKPRPTPAPRTTLARWLQGHGAPIGLTLGAHLAFGSSGGHRSSVARQGMAGVIAMLVVAISVSMWVGGVDRFHDDPPSHGWPWDAVIGNTNFDLPPQDFVKLQADRRLESATRASYGQLALDGESVEALVVDGTGAAPLPLVAGREPRAAGEIAIGGLTMRHHHLSIGSPVEISLANSEFGPGKEVRGTVVGETLAPVLGESEVADVEVVTFDTLAEAGIDAVPRILLATIDPRLDRDATIAALVDDYPEELTLDIVPARAVNMYRVRSVPIIGIALAALFASLLVAYTIGAAAAGHRHELAILRAVGIDRSHLQGMLAWQAGLMLGVVLIAGVPLGLVVGAKAWARVADGIGIRTDASMPPWIALLVLALLGAATAGVAWTAKAQRGSVAAQLHVE